MAQFEVIVGNIGTVYSGNSLKEVLKARSTYIKQSKSNYGKASGESVTVFKNSELWSEFVGLNDLQNDELYGD